MDSRIVEGVKQQPAPPEMLPLGWLAWPGAFSLILAIVLTALVLAKHSGGRSGADFSSQVISARAELPSFHCPSSKLRTDEASSFGLKGPTIFRLRPA